MIDLIKTNKDLNRMIMLAKDALHEMQDTIEAIDLMTAKIAILNAAFRKEKA
jgi:hypothetical protein